MILGAAGGLCFYAVHLVRQILKIDDLLDVFAVHGVGGVLGTLLLAVLMSDSLGGVGYAVGNSMGAQFWRQALGVIATLI